MRNVMKNIIRKTHIINLISILFYIFRINKIQNDKIVCINFNGKGYADNPKYIVEQLIQDGKNYKIIWIVDKSVKTDQFPSNIQTVRKYSLKYFYHLSTAKIWINNTRFSVFVKKRKEQVYIQTWHGCIALKKIEYDAQNTLGEYYKEVMKNDNKMTDYMISNSKYCTEMYRKAFRYSGKIIESGSPRNDILLEDPEEYKIKVYRHFNISNEKRIILYAPTFRDNYDKNPYDIDFTRLKRILEKNGEKWEVLVKFHPLVKKAQNSFIIAENYIDASNYLDIQELIVACDLLITDYSSTMFEAMLADKPVILYANDIYSYKKERDYYFDFKDLPFALTTNNDEIEKIVSDKQLNELKLDYKNFKEKIGLKENGDASKKIAKMIYNICKQ